MHIGHRSRLSFFLSFVLHRQRTLCVRVRVRVFERKYGETTGLSCNTATLWPTTDACNTLTEVGSKTTHSQTRGKRTSIYSLAD